MSTRNVVVWRVVTVSCVAGLVVGSGCGLTEAARDGGATELPDELVQWGDPAPDSDAWSVSVRDANDVDDRFVVIGTGGEVQFSTGKVCEPCEAEGSTILIDGEPRIDIRFGTGPDGEGDPMPFLVSTNGFYIELVTAGDSITFQEETVAFEENDDPSDDLAERVGTGPNPAQDALDQGTTSPCGAGLLGMIPIMLLGLALTGLARLARFDFWTFRRFPSGLPTRSIPTRREGP